MEVPPQQTQHNFWFDTRPGSETMAQHQNLVEVREVSNLFLIPVFLFNFFLLKVVDHQN